MAAICLVLASFVPWLAGCKSIGAAEVVVGPSYHPENVHRTSEQLPREIRRVAVLPMTSDDGQPGLDEGREILQPILVDELGKLKRFELVQVTPDQLRHFTGRRMWAAEEKLPYNFFGLINEELGCDAVLFCRLTRFSAYPPLAVGWNMKLIVCRQPQIQWAADEIFDAGESTVVNAARRYQAASEQLPRALADSRSILQSPGRFGRYAASRLLATLPAR